MNANRKKSSLASFNQAVNKSTSRKSFDEKVNNGSDSNSETPNNHCTTKNANDSHSLPKVLSCDKNVIRIRLDPNQMSKNYNKYEIVTSDSELTPTKTFNRNAPTPITQRKTVSLDGEKGIKIHKRRGRRKKSEMIDSDINNKDIMPKPIKAMNINQQEDKKTKDEDDEDTTLSESDDNILLIPKTSSIKRKINQTIDSINSNENNNNKVKKIKISSDFSTSTSSSSLIENKKYKKPHNSVVDTDEEYDINKEEDKEVEYDYEIAKPKPTKKRIFTVTKSSTTTTTQLSSSKTPNLDHSTSLLSDSNDKNKNIKLKQSTTSSTTTTIIPINNKDIPPPPIIPSSERNYTSSSSVYSPASTYSETNNNDNDYSSFINYNNRIISNNDLKSLRDGEINGRIVDVLLNYYHENEMNDKNIDFKSTEINKSKIHILSSTVSHYVFNPSKLKLFNNIIPNFCDLDTLIIPLIHSLNDHFSIGILLNCQSLYSYYFSLLKNIRSPGKSSPILSSIIKSKTKENNNSLNKSILMIFDDDKNSIESSSNIVIMKEGVEKLYFTLLQNSLKQKLSGIEVAKIQIYLPNIMNGTTKKDIGIVILNYIIHFMKNPPKKLPFTSSILANWFNQTMFDKDINIEREKYLNIIFDLFKSGDCDIVNEIYSNCTTPRSTSSTTTTTVNSRIMNKANSPTTPSSPLAPPYTTNYKTISTQTDPSEESNNSNNNNKLLSLQVDTQTGRESVNLHPVIPYKGIILSLVEMGYCDINFKLHDNKTKEERIIGGVKSIVKCTNTTISNLIESAIQNSNNNNNNNNILTIDLPDMVTYKGYMLLLSFYGCTDISINDDNCVDLIQTCYVLNEVKVLSNALIFLKNNMSVNSFISFYEIKDKLSSAIVDEMKESMNNFIRTNIQFIFDKDNIIKLHLKFVEECLNISDTIFLSSETDLVNGLFYYYNIMMTYKNIKKEVETIDSKFSRLFRKIQWGNVVLQDLIASDSKKLITLEMMSGKDITNRLYFNKELLEYFTSQHLKYSDYFVLYKLYDEKNTCSLSIDEVKSIQNFKFKHLLANIMNDKVKKASENAYNHFLVEIKRHNVKKS